MSLIYFVKLETPGFVIAFQFVYNTVTCDMNVLNRTVGKKYEKQKRSASTSCPPSVAEEFFIILPACSFVSSTII